MNNPFKQEVKTIFLKNINHLSFVLLIILLLPTISAQRYYRQSIHNEVVPWHPDLKPIGVLDVDSFTGASFYNLEIDVPQGTNDLNPKVTVSYNSHLTFQKPSFFGTGWILSSYDYIQRNTNYSFASTGDDYFELYFKGVHYNLENFEKITF